MSKNGLTAIVKSLNGPERGYLQKTKALYNFPNRYQGLLHGMNMYHAETHVEMMLYILINEADILYNKHLYRQAARLLQKAKKIAYLHEEYELITEIVKREELLVFIEVSGHDAMAQTKLLVNEKQALFRKLSNTSHYRELFISVFVPLRNDRPLRTRAQIAQYRKWKEHPLLKSEKSALSTEARLLHLLIRAMIACEAEGAFTESLDYLTRLQDLLKKQPGSRKKHAQIYLAALYLQAENQSQLRYFGQLKKTIEAIREIHTVSCEEKAELFILTTMLEQNACLLSGNSQEVLRRLPSVLKQLGRYKGKNSDYHSAMLYLNLATVYWVSGQPRDALRWIEKILSKKYTGDCARTKGYAGMLRLFLYADTGQHKRMQPLIRNTGALLKQSGSLFNTEKRMLLFFQNVSKTSDDSTEKKWLQFFYSDLQRLQKDPLENRFFLLRYAAAWAESKLRNEPFNKMIQKNTAAA